MQVHDSLSGLVGNTPLVRLRSVTRGIPGATVLAKVEYVNPGGSVKDRIALPMVAGAEVSGPPPGRHHRRADLGQHRGRAGDRRGPTRVLVRLRLPGQGGPGQDPGAARVRGARSWCAPGRSHPTTRTPTTAWRAWWWRYSGRLAARPVRQPGEPSFAPPTTGPEIWAQTDKTVTHFVAGIGTGGTITGAGRYLKEVSGGAVRVIGADPEGSVYRAAQGARTWSRASARTSGPPPTTRPCAMRSSRSATPSRSA